MKAKDLITIKDLSISDIEEIFALAAKLKGEGKISKDEPLKGKTLGLVFQKPSLRTKVSFAAAMAQLGGTAIFLAPDEVKLGEREAIKDVARTLSRYLDGIVARTFKHGDIIELAEYSTVPVINGLSDFSHPCQALADIFTVKEKKSRVKGVKIAFVGDGNNVCNSLLMAAARVGADIAVATPKGYEADKEVVKIAEDFAGVTGSKVVICTDPEMAVAGADVIYTDVWTSMGQEKEKAERLKAFKGFQINEKLCSKAKKDYIIMHCLPAHRGEEISDESLESPHSVVFDQAENRLHVEKAILLLLLK
ncbi:MAG: ornithine carbamoyltransferase [Candidatus Omnitrophica bacterium]|nr:ornithine carbamoyltransferase [Candidatus Omnitrophota bacterium]MDD5545905.1 ornithine carbamoyltransferase [Candidatus Omnitrophota bacterium]